MDKKELQHKKSALIRCWGELIETLFVNKKDFLFNSGREIFNKHVIQEVQDCFSNNPDESRGKGFDLKVEKQFADASDEAKRLFVHAEYIHYMIMSSVKRDTKKQKIGRWKLGELNDRVVLEGISKPGLYYQNRNFENIVFVLNIFKKIIDSTVGDKKAIDHTIENYCKENAANNKGISNAILFFTKPDYYERIISHGHRDKIVSHYDDLIRDNPDYSNMDTDEKISQIKQVLRQERNIPDIDFFEDLADEWGMKGEKPKKGEMVKENKPKMKHESSSINENTINTAAPKIPHPLNQILYGPPGTGKTYRTTRLAKEILGIEDDDINSIKSLRQAYPEQIAFITFHQNFAYEDFIEGIKPNMERDTKNISYSIKEGIFKTIARNATKNLESANKVGSQKNYVLIIDEINRGNMAKVFGELITLLEDTKRLGEEEEMQLTLQYSKEEFGVPNNLFIIGTMNTADRSIAVMDTALRRRFVFTECMPDTSLLNDNVEGVDCKKLLMAINQRIVVLASREKQIGHSYLMHVKTMDDLKNAFQQKIIPLLKEYFFDNWENIKNVLNKGGFIKKDNKLSDIKADLDNSGGDIYEWLDFDKEQWDNPDSYKKIYQIKGEKASSKISSGAE